MNVDPPAPLTAAMRMGIRFRIGLVLLLINVPVGLGGVALGLGLFAKTGHSDWLVIGSATYAISWVMLGVGLLLAGPEGLAHARRLRQRLRPGKKASPPEA